jgi:hypothetical protein
MLLRAHLPLAGVLLVFLAYAALSSTGKTSATSFASNDSARHADAQTTATLCFELPGAAARGTRNSRNAAR